MDDLVMVVPRTSLFGPKNEDFFEGFRPAAEIDYQPRILANYRWMKRADVEEDPTYKQPIVVAVIVNPVSRKIFVYQRASQDERYSERRLQGKFSLCVGGHIRLVDDSSATSGNPIIGSILRELREEVHIGSLNLQVLGYINNETDPVGQVHFGILSLNLTTSGAVLPKDPEIEKGGLLPFEEIDHICSSAEFEVEEWSRIALDTVKLYLESLL